MKFCKHKNIISTCNSDARFLKFTLNIKTYKKFEEFLFKLVLRESLLKNNWNSMKNRKEKRLESLTIGTISSIYLLIWIILEVQTILQKKLINCWCGNWLLINEKMILMVGVGIIFA